MAFGRGRPRGSGFDSGGEQSPTPDDESYIPPQLNVSNRGGGRSATTGAGSGNIDIPVSQSSSRESFVTSPQSLSAQNRGRLTTGKITSLFRRPASRSRDPPSNRSMASVTSSIGGQSSSIQSSSVVYESNPSSSTIGQQEPSNSLKAKAQSWKRKKKSSNTKKKKSKSRKKRGGGEEDNDVNAVPVIPLKRTNSQGSTSSRLFYSADDSSDDSYEERSQSSRQKKKKSLKQSKRTDDDTATYYDDETATYTEFNDDDTNLDGKKVITRFRGFSTSISNLFLDESLVCASIGCFGLILSQRTEYLLNLRNERRGLIRRSATKNSGKRQPSRIVSYALVVTLILIALTFVIFGFGNGKNSNASMEDYYNGYDYDFDADDYFDDNFNNNNNNNNNVNNYNDDGGNWQQQDDWEQEEEEEQEDDDGGWDNGDDGENDENDDNDDGNENQDNNQNDDENNNNGDENDNRRKDRRAEVRYDDAYDIGILIYNDETNNTHIISTMKHSHPINGIFKIRDYQENLWDPLYAFIKHEWYRDSSSSDITVHNRVNDTTTTSTPTKQYHDDKSQRSNFHRFLENDDGDDYLDSSSSSSSSSKKTSSRDLGASIRSGLCIAFLVLLGVVGRRRRMRTRYALVRARAQEDHLFYASTETPVHIKFTKEDQYDGACSHTLCGCYPSDPPDVNNNDQEDNTDTNYQDEDKNETTSTNGTSKRKKQRKYEDCISRAFNCLMASCCGCACKCWFQFLSVCALAQEAREVRLLLPPKLQRIDFLTHQPFHEYQEDIHSLRKGYLGLRKLSKHTLFAHIQALSKLSRYILCVFAFMFLVISLTLMFNPRASFSWPDAIVLIATFVQSFIVLYIVHWIFHKSDLSLDAVIKFFTAGFVIAVPTAFFFEGLLVNMVLFVVYGVYAFFELIKGEAFVNWVVNNYRVLWIIGEIFNAYIVAAVTEELCKYYTFRSVEHPDLIFLTGLDRKSHEQSAVDGGKVKYQFTNHQISAFNKRVSSFQSESEYSQRSKRSASSSWSVSTKEEFLEDDTDVRTYRQKASAVTTGMISVAVGLACAENFLYVFFLGGTANGAVGDEWMVLLFRSIFPVHALAAALQSINMIRKFIECSAHNGHNIGIGRIIFPAVLLHGTFDAILMCVNAYVETSWDNYAQDDDGGDGSEPYNVLLVNLLAWTSIIVVMLYAVIWYVREHRSQKLRLKRMEQREEELNRAPSTMSADDTTLQTEGTLTTAGTSNAEVV